MTQSELERAVARATGESRSLIRRYGFSLASEEPETLTDPVLVLDCPGCGACLNATSPPKLVGELECPRCDAVYPFEDHELYVADGPEGAIAA